MKFATFLLLAMPAIEGSHLFKTSMEPAGQDSGLVQYNLGADGVVENETIASDFASFIKAWGIDFKTTWFAQRDPNKASLWTFLTTISSQLSTIHDSIGLHEEDHGGALVTLKDYIVTLRSEIKNDMTTTQ